MGWGEEGVGRCEVPSRAPEVRWFGSMGVGVLVGVIELRWWW